MKKTANNQFTNKCKKIMVSDERCKYLRKNKQNAIIVHFFRIFLLITFITLWEISVQFNIIDGFLFSSPTKILNSLKKLNANGELFDHIFITLFETITGYVIATLTGTFIAVILWWSQKTRKILEPYLVVLNALPKIALGPIIIIAFGADIQAIIFMTVLVTVIVTSINMLCGFLQTDNGKMLLLRSMGANKLTILTKLVLPQALPSFISILKVNVGLSWIGSIMGEYIVSRKGLGYLIVYGGQVLNLDLVMTSTVLLCLLASLMYACVLLFEYVAVKKRK